MKSLTMRTIPVSLVVSWLLIQAPGSLSGAANQPAKKTAPTVAEATKVFDPAKFPVLTKEPIPQKYVGGFSYQAKATPKAAYEFHQQALMKLKWKELPDSYLSDMSCSGNFSKDGYLLSLSATPAGGEGEVLVTLHNHSNLPLKKLPMPAGVKPFYSVPGAEAYLTAAGRDETAAAVTKLLIAQGWEPYGTAGDQLFFKQHAVRLSANVTTAPAQNNQTVVTYSTDQLSADLPAPADAIGLQYSDSTKSIFFDVAADLATVHRYYNDTLESSGWKPTLDKPILIDFRQTVIYRNLEKDLLTLEMFDFEGKLRVKLIHQSAQEVAEQEARMDAKLAQKKAKAAEKSKSDKLSVALPVDAKEVKSQGQTIEFTIAAGKAKPFAESLRKKLMGEEWQETTAMLDPLVGLIILEKGEKKLTITYTETGVLPSEVTLTSDGVELERAKKK